MTKRQEVSELGREGERREGGKERDLAMILSFYYYMQYFKNHSLCDFL